MCRCRGEAADQLGDRPVRTELDDGVPAAACGLHGDAHTARTLRREETPRADTAAGVPLETELGCVGRPILLSLLAQLGT